MSLTSYQTALPRNMLCRLGIEWRLKCQGNCDNSRLYSQNKPWQLIRSMPNTDQNWLVLKFGGTSVSSLKCWQTIASVIKERQKEGLRPLIICSALLGVTSDLERLLKEVKSGRANKIIKEIEKKHQALCKELGLKSEVISDDIKELNRLIVDASLTNEISPQLKAKFLSFGEIMSSRLGAAYLEKQGVPTAWCDARKYLVAHEYPGMNVHRSFLHAVCSYDFDENLRKNLEKISPAAIITQGFIAHNPNSETVLLGRGGSDSSAAYFAAKLKATRCEIWTDVPGMYTANPRQIPVARLLKTLDYDEALEIASSGAKVLHPRCIAPLRKQGIPLHIKWIDHPNHKGTVISPDAQKTGAQVKAISAKQGITLVSMETADMWHQVGFLAHVFDCFKRHGLSIDLISTSETNVTVSLDQTTNALDPITIKTLVVDLEKICRTKIISSCALVSLVGKNIRTILHQLSGALEVFEEQKIYLVSQAANDLNLTFVVDEEQAERLVQELHGQIFSQRKNDSLLGPTWGELFERPGEQTSQAKPWWQNQKDELIELAENKSPLYIYNEATIDKNLAKLSKIKSIDRVFYSIKANANPQVLTKIEKAGLGFECVSFDELEHITRLFPKINRNRLLFTPNFAARKEYEKALELKAMVTLDNLYPLENWPNLFRDKDIYVRMDPAKGKGHHKYVHTAGTKTKFGIPESQLEELANLVKKSGARVKGLHAHIGSNIFTPDTWSEVGYFLAKIAERFPDVKSLDLGGGLGVVEKPTQEALNLEAIDENLKKFKKQFPKYKLWIEPGRFIVAESGVLLTRVTQTKQKGEYNYIGVDAGMNTFIRPALYGSYHEIVNLSRLNDKEHVTANIVGPICESGDILGYGRYIVPPKEGDVILIATVGAYGRVMSSNYNLRPPAEEYFLTA